MCVQSFVKQLCTRRSRRLSAAPLRIIGGPRSTLRSGCCWGGSGGFGSLCSTRGSRLAHPPGLSPPLPAAGGGARVVLDGAYISCALQDPARIASFLAQHGIAALAPSPHPSAASRASASAPLADAEAALSSKPSSPPIGDLASAYGPLSESGAGGEGWSDVLLQSTAAPCCGRRKAVASPAAASGAATTLHRFLPRPFAAASVSGSSASTELEEGEGGGAPVPPAASTALWRAREAVAASRGTVIYCNPNAGGGWEGR